ncbi:hypothetical protein AVDCRST_MAG81-4205 [uncultured Synechococcales cyanobacterium]|uniref:Uncharacterized protein n=1 Tax=uncultured Synechococcales cyanobacterium TaxID=1936017 RepID=A0A6J4VYB8_9CYAN|nr:hypothetical protein AVDCRST_MAG81-4205 [uncultured Synechococcales cyanobacterium]
MDQQNSPLKAKTELTAKIKAEEAEIKAEEAELKVKTANFEVKNAQLEVQDEAFKAQAAELEDNLTITKDK